VSEPNTGRRLAVIGILVMALFAGILTRLWFLQVTGGEKLAVAAQRQRDRFVTVPAVRGTIYDRNGIPLAQTVPVTSLMVDRQQLSPAERATLEKNLGALLGKTPDDVGQLIDNTNYAAFEPVPVAKDIDLGKAIYVTEHRSEFPQVSVTRTAERRYPNDYQAADILGYVGQINADELKSHEGDGYDARDTIGKTGIEQMFESQLRGKPGKDKVEVDNQGRAVNVVEVQKPQAGNDVRLTLDLPTQHIAEESLAQGMNGARSQVDPDSGNHYVANAGAVVVLDARTGAVVAMASNPSFNPNDFISGSSDQYFKDPNSPLLNRALNPLAPGSTFKPFTSIAMLQSPTLFPDGANTVYSDYPDGCFHFGNDQKACNAAGAVLGAVDLPSALTVSSDVYFYTAGNEFWKAYRNEGQNATGNHNDDVAGDKIPDAQHPLGNAIQHTARTYGFGALTGVGLGDQAGTIPDHEYKVKLNKDPALQIWYRGDNTNLAVGQGDVLVTPLQLANAYAAFANGGTLYQPRLADEVTQSSAGLPAGQLGAPVSTIQPIVKRTTALTPDVRAPIESGLAGAVDPHGRGTAAGAFNGYDGMPVIGKTGTAQRPGKQDTSWFAAITNPDSTDPAVPQYVVVAMVEQGGFGASTAAPIARRVIDFLNHPTQTPSPVVIAPAVGNEQSN
jgi:penicillin-binding protein 2